MKLLIMVSKFLSCWSHHKLRLQRPMAARNHYRGLQYDSYEPFGTGMQLEQRRRRKLTTNPLLPLLPNRHPTRDCRQGRQSGLVWGLLWLGQTGWKYYCRW